MITSCVHRVDIERTLWMSKNEWHNYILKSINKLTKTSNTCNTMLDQESRGFFWAYVKYRLDFLATKGLFMSSCALANSVVVATIDNAELHSGSPWKTLAPSFAVCSTLDPVFQIQLAKYRSNLSYESWQSKLVSLRNDYIINTSSHWYIFASPWLRTESWSATAQWMDMYRICSWFQRVNQAIFWTSPSRRSTFYKVLASAR